MRYLTIVPLLLLLAACGSKGQHDEAKQYTNASEYAAGNRSEVP